MPSSTANAIIVISASRLGQRASFQLNEAKFTGKFAECVRRCARLFQLSVIGKEYTPKLFSARSNVNFPLARPGAPLPHSAKKLFYSAWPSIFTDCGDP